MPLLPFGAEGWVERTGWNALWWMGPIWILLVMPVLDTVFGTDASNPPEWAVPQLEADRYYRWCTYLYLPLQYLGFFWAAGRDGTATCRPLSELGLALTVGTVAGVGINTAHELGHKRDRLERRLSKVALAQTGYGHFYVEHNRATTPTCRPPRTRPAPGSASRSGRSCPARWWGACARRGRWPPPPSGARAGGCGRGATTSSTPGR